MRITREQATENRTRVLDAAARLFREKGFDGVGVAELMAAAGLTHGGFYNHFSSKEALEAAACEKVFARSIGKVMEIGEIPERDQRDAAFVEYRGRYLSSEARDAPAPSCPMVAFAGDMTRQPTHVREAYARGLREYLEGFARASGLSDRRESLRAFCEIAGALTLARSVAEADPDLSDEILNAPK